MPEVQTVFAEYGDEYETSHSMTIQQRKALHAIKLCRTSAMGGHMDECPECGFQRPSYNSCRNRHCPKCQTLLKERWIENQSFDLLNIQYFHVVFTVPAELDPLFLSNQEKLYRLLFSCAAETLTQLAWDKKYLPGTRNILVRRSAALRYCTPGDRIFIFIRIFTVLSPVAD